jgi:hypothetical protein
MTDETEAQRRFRRGMADLESRLETIRAVSQSTVNASDSRTIEGMRAHKVMRMLDEFEEELAKIAEIAGDE